MTPGMPPVTLAAGDHGLVSDTVGLFTALLGFAATVGILTEEDDASAIGRHSDGWRVIGANRHSVRQRETEVN